MIKSKCKKNNLNTLNFGVIINSQEVGRLKNDGGMVKMKSYRKDCGGFSANKISVGEKYPLPLPKDLPINGGIFEILESGVCLQLMKVSSPSDQEMDQFNRDPINIKVYGDLKNGKNVFYVGTNLAVVENQFNPKLYKDARMENVLSTDMNMVIFIVLDENETVKAIKFYHASEKNRAWDRLKRVWARTMESGLTKEEYISWCQKEILPYRMNDLLDKSTYFGKMSVSINIENFCFLEESDTDREEPSGKNCIAFLQT